MNKPGLELEIKSLAGKGVAGDAGRGQV